ncbi:MAG: hypothetical protein J6S67_04195 [Methanobrevibacter sp.]|nr:hypothetical protein [Methanobrevibacter sp.]
MKQGKRLTREQKAIVQGHGLNVKEYRFVEQINESYIKIVNVNTGIQKTVDVYKKSKNRWDF